MTPQDIDTKGEAAIIRALIITRGPTGSTLEQIRGDYMEQTGRNLMHDYDDYSLSQWLEKITHVTSKVQRGQNVYFSHAPGQQHLAKMIQKQQPRSNKNTRRRSKMMNDSFRYNDDSYYATPGTWANSLIFRRSQLMNVTYQTNQSTMDETMEHHQTPHNDKFVRPVQPQAPKRQLPFSSVDDNERSKRFCSKVGNIEEPESEYDHNNNISSCINSNTSSLTDRFSELEDHIDPFLPEFYKCILVGDNFFLNLAVMDMGFRMVNRDRILQSGFCVSGQTIAEAARNIENIGANQIILLNVGSIDIVQGKELVDMIYGMFRLLRICRMNQITPILTTLLPLANYRLGNRATVTNGFNEFLVKNPFNFPVIELHKTFTNDDGMMSQHFYQQSTRFVSGLRKPLVFWNRMGRQRIMKALTQQLGSAILKILIE